MPPAFTRDEVSAVAALANLDLTGDELDLFARQLGDVLAAAQELQQLETTGVPPTASLVTRHAVDRPDQVGPCLDRDAALAAAPDAAMDEGFFKVPRVIG
jgi:aspartyl-tRNA(Asn)/glutamyl-tRNA(Gln) amidotransferase subunit C